MSRFVAPSDRRSFPIAVAALLSLLASACPFSDNYAVDNDGDGGDAGGGAAGTGGTGGVIVPISSTTTSMATVGGAGGESCEAPATPPGGACPSECDSCAGATCIIACGGGEPEDTCEADIIACPAGFACEIQCVGKDACKDASVMCPVGYGCHVTCDGDDSCKSTAILCGGGECAVACNSPQACKEADFACGAGGFCSCDGFAQPLQTSGCTSACSCTGCE